jgi:hypothetical protein
MLSYIYSKRLPVKAEAAKSSLSALIFNNLANGYTPTNLIKQVTRDNTYL